MTNTLLPHHSELGKKSDYESIYNPNHLFPILREQQRADIGIKTTLLPFHGVDIWNHFEVSWLNEKGKPLVAVATIVFDAKLPYLIESKSMKLYFNSFNNTHFKDANKVAATIKQDIEARVKGEVQITLYTLDQARQETISPSFEGHCIDHLDVECTQYSVNPHLLTVDADETAEVLTSDLLRSNCLVTGQPDWGSVQIAYKGRRINHENLLRYIVSFRNHLEFGEHCAERIFMDLLNYCRPLELTVFIRYTRRGGIDINCHRSSRSLTLGTIPNARLIRQ